MKLLVQPDDGTAPILAALSRAKKSIEIVIFRMDRREIEESVRIAASRGVFVRALVAFANRGGEEQLRRLESRFLEAGVTVTRTGDDMVKYHYKMLLVDRRTLYVFSYNYTTADLLHSRGFAIVTRNRALVQEAAKLFEADAKRQPYATESDKFVVSPVNARKRLAEFIAGARRELLIYDPKISDWQMVRLLVERQKSGVAIKIIGRLGKKANGLSARRLSTTRLHTRTIIRDRTHAFVGSQSLRKPELDSRRELGLIVNDPTVVGRLAAVFEKDWAVNETKEVAVRDARSGKRRSNGKADLQSALDPLSSSIKRAVKKVVAANGKQALMDDETKENLKQAVKKTVKQAFREAVEETAARMETA